MTYLVMAFIQYEPFMPHRTYMNLVFWHFFPYVEWFNNQYTNHNLRQKLKEFLLTPTPFPPRAKDGRGSEAGRTFHLVGRNAVNPRTAWSSRSEDAPKPINQRYAYLCLERTLDSLKVFPSTTKRYIPSGRSLPISIG